MQPSGEFFSNLIYEACCVTARVKENQVCCMNPDFLLFIKVHPHGAVTSMSSSSHLLALHASLDSLQIPVHGFLFSPG